MLTELGADGHGTFADGSHASDVGAVIYCTGYQYDFPFLEGTGLVTTANQHVSPLYLHMLPPSVAPSLSFVGLPWKVRRWQWWLELTLAQACFNDCSGQIMPCEHLLIGNKCVAVIITFPFFVIEQRLQLSCKLACVTRWRFLSALDTFFRILHTSHCVPPSRGYFVA